MGGFLQGFVGGLSNSVTQQLQQKHQEDQDAKKQHQDYLQKVIFDQTGTFNETEKQNAVNEYTKTAGPQAKKFLSQNAPIMQALHKLSGGLITGRKPGQQQQPFQVQGGQGAQPVSPPAPGTFGAQGAQGAAPQGYYDSNGEWVSTGPAAAGAGGATATVPPSAFGLPGAGGAPGQGGATAVGAMGTPAVPAGTPTAKARFNNTPPFFQQPGITAPGSSASAGFNTPIPPERQADYQNWLQQESQRKGYDASQDAADYDIQGYFLSGEKPDPQTGHGTDKFKKPNHPTFSTDSNYNGVNGEAGGRWVTDKNGKTAFYASPTNLKYHSAADLQKYFKEHEPDVKLVLPKAKQRFNATPPPTPPLRVMTYEEKIARRTAELQKEHELATQWGQESDVYQEHKKAREAQEQYDRGVEEIDRMQQQGIKLTDSQKAEILTGGKISAAPVPKPIDPKVHTATWKGADGKEVTRSLVWDPEQNDGHGDWVSATTHKKIDIPEEAVIAPAPTRAAASGQIRSVPHAVSVQDAIALQKEGASYKDQNGNEFDLSKVPQDMGLQAMVQGDRMFYVPVSPNERTVDVGGVRFGVTPWEIKSIGRPPGQPAAAGPAPLGQAQPGSTTTGQQIVQTPQGPVATGGIRRPNVPGPNPNILGGQPPQPAPAMPTPTQPPGQGAAPAQPPAQPGTGAPPAPRPPAPPAQPPGAPRPQAQAPPAAPPRGVAGPPMAGVPQGMYNTQAQQLGPAMVAIGQLFGNTPDDPTSFAAYGDLADDAHARKTMGTAWNFILKGLNAELEQSGGHVGAMVAGTGGALPIESLLNWLMNNWNVPANLAGSEQKEYAKVLDEMTPREKEALNAQINAMSNVVGMRKLYGGLATQTSVQTLERDVPTIGVLAQSSPEFYDKLAALAKEAGNGTRLILPGMFPPGGITRDRMQGLEKEMRDKAAAARKKATGGTKAAGPKVFPKGRVQEYADKNFKGDLAKARAQILKDGYVIQ